MDKKTSIDNLIDHSHVVEKTDKSTTEIKVVKPESALKRKSSASHPVQHVKFKLGAGDDEGHYSNEPLSFNEYENDIRTQNGRKENKQLLIEKNKSDIDRIASKSTISSLENNESSNDHSHYYHDINPEKVDGEVLVELFDLKNPVTEGKNKFWEQTSRWLKYEEDAEEINNRWGQPHVAFLSFDSLIQLRKVMSKGEFHFDADINNFNELYSLLAQSLYSEGLLKCDQADGVKHIKDILTLNHKSVGRKVSRSNTQASSILSINFSNSFSRNRSTSQTRSASFQTKTSLSSLKPHSGCETVKLINNDISTKINENRSFPNLRKVNESNDNINDCIEKPKRRLSVFQMFSEKNSSDGLEKKNSFYHKYDDIFKNLPKGCEKANVLCGCIPDMTKARLVMIRLKNAVYLDDFSDSNLPLRFIFVVLGPVLDEGSYHELGRALSTLLADSHFRRIAYASYSKSDLIDAVDYFLNDSIVIPPGGVDNKKLLWNNEIKRFIKKKRADIIMTERKGAVMNVLTRSDLQKVHASAHHSINMSHHNFSNDEKKDSKCSMFKGLRNDIISRIKHYTTDITDAFNLQCLSSVVFMFFACFAPAITFGGLMGSYTEGQMGVTETLMAQCICGILWGFFGCQPLIIMSATGPVLVFEAALYTFCQNFHLDFLTIRLITDGSRLLKYVTRYTEDIFATLISFIFITESLKFIKHTFHDHPVENFAYYQEFHNKCGNVSTIQNIKKVPDVDAFKNLIEIEPNTALLTAMITFGVFAFAFCLKKLRDSFFLGRQARRLVGDFGVLISIATFAIIVRVFFKDPYISTLEMKKDFDFTNSTARGHGLIIYPKLASDDLFFGCCVGFGVALLVFILLFVETEITELLLDRKERGLKKGSGRDWDLLLVGLLCLLMSFIGLPWMCAAAVQSLAHCGSLTVMKKKVPGARPEVDYVIEQRITTIGIGLSIGVVAFFGEYLQLPMAALFGVFLYLGVMNLSGVQLKSRIILFFIPEKYHPVVPYTENVRLRKMHLYTTIQILCLIFIIFIKTYFALLFPFILIIFILIRLFIFPYIFNEKELKALDGEDDQDDDEWMERDFYENAPIPV
ncbi:Anion exchange protein family and Bicarbonate transporter, eukaryotic family and Bicarbonate transporter, C-terminal domain and Band 3 cytoplasmic domain and Phosphotransferase/anion transporter domain-containing protein [Strongyloides ratti]|uniref:Anion exchange protein n=1 Tax=Strongyloides ratti TaxID=34506 RepID=A0A090N107_STRRB|nr:Anion exchange protein family and Bicarbonate transporter, eukaryotic family and Bicarbonate transporter, C-terminal domain and Band 3 cytoplasmic domain and Phosphotransferase/anion transporter domain-containing protein [Strongyloides ratti]CEF71608.1 Anion exchange protein family and Bicarbonate transporter, eukaryotic family and Bicarbonate transporter, C-terminal domain and Band 3 cytoplasmic domain and Phosphotransferase/anion transporter domain-containing protein [Strongyloides ratti]